VSVPTAAARPRFRYLRDPVFLGSVAIYLLNRFVLRPATGNPADFFHCQLNDVLCIPFWLPPSLWLARGLRLRQHDEPPTVGELMLFLLLWSWLFEVLVQAKPLRVLFPNSVGDAWDIVAYAGGAVLAGLLWRSRRGPRTRAPGSRPGQHATIAIAIVLAAIAASVTAMSQNAWREDSRRWDCIVDLEQLAEAIESYRAAHGRRPQGLQELDETALQCLGSVKLRLDWIDYRVEDGVVQLVDLGADHARGGHGGNRDVYYPVSLQPEDAWYEFWCTRDAADALASGSLLGVVVAGTWWWWRRRRKPTPCSLRSAVDSLLWVGLALFVGVFVLVTQNNLAMPSGH
jgi:hypothetical protein